MFHDIRFPTAISRASHGGPERRTDVVVLGSGAEERNARWADSRRSYNAGYGVKSLNDLHAVIAFFEERRGRLHGFRWRDPSDWKSCPPESKTNALFVIVAFRMIPRSGDRRHVSTSFTLPRRRSIRTPQRQMAAAWKVPSACHRKKC